MIQKTGDLKNIKGISERDRKMIEEAEAMLGPEPGEMGFIKNLFWGNIRQELAFPYPEVPQEEKSRCDAILAKLKDYLENEHPRVQIDQEEAIPDWCIKKLFSLGVMGMNIPKEYGGQGLGVTSYNRALEMIGSYCASTAVVVSAHQSIGCKALVLFGSDDQKKKWLPRLANDMLSAFSLSEPNVGCDAGGQETRCKLSEDGEHYILDGEKKWSTSGALSGMFTVMAKQTFADPKTGKTHEAVSALICTPDMPGIEVIEKNRSKCGIRGTWQARIRFTGARVPKANLLHKEGKGLQVALSCLNYGRCTLSAGMLGSARTCMDQAVKWAQTRYQFKRPLADFELVQQKIARMAAYTYAIDAALYFTTGILDRHDGDIMVETAACKIFASEMGWRAINDAMQIMGGEGYMTENEVERAFRDARIYLIVEGANEVMQSFVFSYGGKQLAESMLGIQAALTWNGKESLFGNLTRIARHSMNMPILTRALGIAGEVFLGIRKAAPRLKGLHPDLAPWAGRFEKLVQDHAYQFKKISYQVQEKIVTRGSIHARLADMAMWLHASACVLSKLDRQLKAGAAGAAWERDRAAGLHFLDMAEGEYRHAVEMLFRNPDETMDMAAKAALAYSDTLPHSKFVLPERSPNAKGQGRTVKKDFIKQFPGKRAA
jgi:acyl-CoA dehydrogenase family protein 9